MFLGKVKDGLTEANVKEYFESNFDCKCDTVDLIREKAESLPEGQEPKLRLEYLLLSRI